MKNSRDGKSYSTNLAHTPPEYWLQNALCEGKAGRIKRVRSHRQGERRPRYQVTTKGRSSTSPPAYVRNGASDVFCRGALAEGCPTCCRSETWQTIPRWNDHIQISVCLIQSLCSKARGA